MGKEKREQSLAPKRSREELAKYFMNCRLQEAERKALEYAHSLHPQDSEPS